MKDDKIKKLLPKSLWVNENKEHRVILFVKNQEVYFAPRGGNALNRFWPGESSSINTFLLNSEHVGDVTKAEWDQVQKDLEPWIKVNKVSDAEQIDSK